MHNFTIVSKGEYNHKQTSDLLRIVRYMIIRKKQKRFLLLDMENKNPDKLTALWIQGDQYDEKGNFLGVINVTMTDLEAENGRFLLKEHILLHEDCTDVFVKIAVAEYGDYQYRLDENGNYSVYETETPKEKVPFKEVSKETGKNGFTSAHRQFKAPFFVSVLSVIVLLVVIGLSTWLTFAFKQGREGFFLQGVQYEYAGGDASAGSELIVTGYSEFGGGKMVIESEINGHPVTQITARLRGDSRIKEVVVNGNVRIGENAFVGCKNLARITLNGVSEIGANAFERTGLQYVEINECDIIGDMAFSGCRKIQSVVISNKFPDNVLQLGEKVFEGCGNMGTVTIDQYIKYGENINYFDGVESIKNLTLKNYNYSTYESDRLNIQKPLIELFGSAGNYFPTVNNLHIKYASSLPNDFMLNMESDLRTVTIDVLTNPVVGDRAFADCYNLREVNVPAKFTAVGESAFQNTSITRFNAEKLERIGINAFYGCWKLKDFDLTQNVTLTKISDGALSGTDDMDIYIPASVNEIGVGAFCGSRVKKVTFAENCLIEEIPEDAFAECDNLTSISLPDSIKKIGDRAFSSCFALKNLSLPDGLETIGEFAFEFNFKMTDLIVPDSVTEIGSDILYSCSSIQNITIPFLGETIYDEGGLTYLLGEGTKPMSLTVKITADNEVGRNAFAGFSTLTKIELSPATETIKDGAFYGCTGLREISIPGSVINISNTAFEDCNRLYSIKNDSSINIVKGVGIAKNALVVYSSNSNQPYIHQVENYTFLNADNKWYLIGVPENGKLVLPKPSAVIYSYIIPDYLFYESNCSEILISSAVVKIGDKAFAKSYFDKVTFTSGTIQLGEGVFEDAGLTTVDFSGAGVQSLSKNTFANAYNLKNVTLPANLINIGAYAFQNCSSLYDINLPTSLFTIDSYAFNGCSLSKVDLSNTDIHSIGDRAFASCYLLSSATLPNSLEEIGEGVFENCNNLTSLSVPFLGKERGSESSVGYLFGFTRAHMITKISITDDTVIGNEAFKELWSLEEVVLSDKIDTIQDNAFDGCANLYKINMPQELTFIGNYAFAGLGIKSVTLPNSLMHIGNNAFANCQFLETVTFSKGTVGLDIGYDAFINCPIYQVYDLAGLGIQVGSSNFGGVAQNALVVYTNESATPLKDYTYKGISYKYTDNVCVVTRIESNEAEIGSVTINGKLYDKIIIGPHVCNGIIYKLTITDAVVDIRSGAFGGYIDTVIFKDANVTIKEGTFTGDVVNVVYDDKIAGIEIDAFRECEYFYFYGSEREWNSSWLDGEIYYKYQPDYYYSECFHESGLGLWNYTSDGEINTEYQDNKEDCEYCKGQSVSHDSSSDYENNHEENVKTAVQYKDGNDKTGKIVNS